MSARRTCLCRLHLPGIRLTSSSGRDGGATPPPTSDGSSSAVLLSLETLEEYLEDGLMEEEDSVSSSSSHPPVEYKLQADVVWTNARRPCRPLHTVLGLAEEQPDEDTAMASPCQVTVYNATGLDLDNTCPCTCSLPTPPWKEKTSSASEDVHHGATPDGVDDTAARRRRIDWIDLTSLAADGQDRSSLFPTPRSVLHFYRSLLGTDHDASPWSDQHADRARADVVILELPSDDDSNNNKRHYDVLHRFRVSDASPSWALHAVVPSWRAPFNNNHHAVLNNVKSISTAYRSSLWIYKRLPSRDCLTTKHPVTQQPVPVDSCLWETFKKKTSPGDDENDATPELSYRLVAPPYLDAAAHYPETIRLLRETLHILQAEAKQIPHWAAWPEQQHYQAAAEDENGEDGAPWNVFPLCYCFPAHDASRRRWVPATTAAVPETTRLLRSLGDVLRTALFSRLDPGARLEAHTGWQDLANHVVRLHVPLDIPDDEGGAPTGLCGTWVDGCVMTHASASQQPWVCFDDSKTHRAFNYSTAYRTVLILDLARPPAWPRGTATGGHSDELDAFIQQMSAPR